MKIKQLIAIVAFIPGLAFAGDFGGFGGINGPVTITNPNVYNATGSNPSVPNSGSNSAANATGGFGGMGGTAAGGVASANGSVSNSVTTNSRSYALGMSSLAASANACQGSFSFAIIAGTYTVRFCELMQKAIVMGNTGFDARSIQNVMCLDPDIAQSSSECNR